MSHTVQFTKVAMVFYLGRYRGKKTLYFFIIIRVFALEVKLGLPVVQVGYPKNHLIS